MTGASEAMPAKGAFLAVYRNRTAEPETAYTIAQYPETSVYLRSSKRVRRASSVYLLLVFTSNNNKIISFA